MGQKQSPSATTQGTFTGTMTFPQAMQAVIDGKRITRVEWDDPKIYGALRNDKLMLQYNGWHTWTVNLGDMEAGDWIVLE